MDLISEFRCQIEIGKRKILDLEKVHAALVCEGRHYEAELILSAQEGCRKACIAAEKMINSGDLELINNKNIKIQQLRCFMQ
ncbi:MAG: hypothetical protein ABIT04_11910 [Novosphingobium sp.]